jgi:hypothetical protein
VGAVGVDMLSDIENVRKILDLLGDDGFVGALTSAEKIVDEADDTLRRVEQVEAEAEATVREANETLKSVDRRLAKVDETIRLLEAKIEGGFSLAFFFFAVNRFLAGEVLLAAGLFGMGLLGVSALAITIYTLPQVQRLRELAAYVAGELGIRSGTPEEPDWKPVQRAGSGPEGTVVPGGERGRPASSDRRGRTAKRDGGRRQVPDTEGRIDR